MNNSIDFDQLAICLQGSLMTVLGGMSLEQLKKIDWFCASKETDFKTRLAQKS